MSRCGHSLGPSVWYVPPRVLKIHLLTLTMLLTPSPGLLFVSRATRALHLTGDVQRL